MNDVSQSPLPKLPPRQPESHKGDYGRVLIMGGSRGMAGAPALAGCAALRSGAGLVTLAVPRSIQSTVAGFEPSYMTIGLARDADDHLLDQSKPELFELAENKSAIAIGPGLGTASGTKQLVGELYQLFTQPLVVDADGLNALADTPLRLEKPTGVRILTPHPGEFQRLTGNAAAGDSATRAEQAAQLCQRDSGGRTIVVLKGHQTVIASSEHFAINQNGNPGMATGGTGDCLTGMITALLGQGMSPFDAARLGVHIHGLAGDLAAEQLGQISMIASDLIDFLPAAFQQLPDGKE